MKPKQTNKKLNKAILAAMKFLQKKSKIRKSNEKFWVLNWKNL
jgi:hypothetical protein